jgi:hypothetical protein
MMTKMTPAEARARLEALGEVLEEIASGIRNAQQVLVETEDLVNTAYLVAHTLGRRGWMADQGCVVAGAELPPAVGDAHAWLLIPKALSGERRHSIARD